MNNIYDILDRIRVLDESTCTIGDIVSCPRGVSGKIIADLGSKWLIKDDSAETDDDELEFNKSDCSMGSCLDESTKATHVTGDGKTHSSEASAIAHANAVHKKTGNVISVVKAPRSVQEVSDNTLTRDEGWEEEVKSLDSTKWYQVSGQGINAGPFDSRQEAEAHPAPCHLEIMSGQDVQDMVFGDPAGQYDREIARMERDGTEDDDNWENLEIDLNKHGIDPEGDYGTEHVDESWGDHGDDIRPSKTTPDDVDADKLWSIVNYWTNNNDMSPEEEAWVWDIGERPSGDLTPEEKQQLRLIAWKLFDDGIVTSEKLDTGYYPDASSSNPYESEGDQINELHPDTYGDYISAAAKDARGLGTVAGQAWQQGRANPYADLAKDAHDSFDRNYDKSEKRLKGITMATNRLLKKVTNENADCSPSEIQAKIKEVNKKIDAIVQDGGKVLLNDPLTKELNSLRTELTAAKKVNENEKPLSKLAKQIKILEDQYAAMTVEPEDHDESAADRRKRLQALADKQEDDAASDKNWWDKDNKPTSAKKDIKGSSYGGSKQKDDAEELGEAIDRGAKKQPLLEGAIKQQFAALVTELECSENFMSAVNLGDNVRSEQLIRREVNHNAQFYKLGHATKEQLVDAALEEFGFGSDEFYNDDYQFTPDEDFNRFERERASDNDFDDNYAYAELDEISKLAGINAPQQTLIDEVGDDFPPPPPEEEFVLEQDPDDDFPPPPPEEDPIVLEQDLEDSNHLDLTDYTGFYILDQRGNYIDGPFDDHRMVRHEMNDLDPAGHSAHHVEFFKDADYRYRFMELPGGNFPIAPPEEDPIVLERDITHSNTPDEKEFGLAAAVPSGNDLTRAKRQYRREYPGDNPMAVQEAKKLWDRYSNMLKGAIK